MGHQARVDANAWERRCLVSDPIVIKRGMRVVFKPEWRDKGDGEYTYVAVEDADAIDGGFYFSAVEIAMWIRPRHPAHAHMVESAEPYLSIATLTFLGLSKKKGARVQMRRTLGDQTLLVTEETITRSKFYDLFQRHAAHTKVGEELISTVEFSDIPAKVATL